jgi:chitin disaccharide deacetylase
VRYLIVNADDFGASSGINRGILEAHEHGILTSTSLMVNMPAALEAIAISRGFPELGIGLHVNFTNEGDDAVADVADTGACRRELARQFDRFVALVQRLPSHLDSHHNVHQRANLRPLFLDLASRYRLPLRDSSRVTYFRKFYGQWADGSTHLDWISPENLVRLLETGLSDDFTELSCHPGYVDPAFPSVYNVEREAELRTLCDPLVREWLVRSGVNLINFGAVSKLAENISA